MKTYDTGMNQEELEEIEGYTSKCDIVSVVWVCIDVYKIARTQEPCVRDLYKSIR